MSRYTIRLRDDREIVVAGIELRSGHDGANGAPCSVRQYGMIQCADGSMVCGDELPGATNATMVRAEVQAPPVKATMRGNLEAVLGRPATAEEWERFCSTSGN